MRTVYFYTVVCEDEKFDKFEIEKMAQGLGVDAENVFMDFVPRSQKEVDKEGDEVDNKETNKEKSNEENIKKQKIYITDSTMPQKSSKDAKNQNNDILVSDSKIDSKTPHNIAGQDSLPTGPKNLLKEGDLLHIRSISDLGTTIKEIRDNFKAIYKIIGADIVVADMPWLDTRTDMLTPSTPSLGDIIPDILTFVIDFEYTTARKRQAIGINKAKERGISFGRPVKKPPADFAEIVKDWEDGDITLAEALERSKLSESSFYRRLREYRDMRGG